MENDSAKVAKTRGKSSSKKKNEPALQPRAENGAVPQANFASSAQQFEDVADDENLSPFSSYLRYTIKQDRSEITRIANELNVAENTVYRWMNGSTEPREIHLKKLLDVLPTHRSDLTAAINQTFPGILDSLSTNVREVQKDIYRRVLELTSLTFEDDDRCWRVTQAIFEYALLQLDAERRGLAITFAKLTARHEDGFHSLYEMDMRGTYPWPFTFEAKAYLGSNTLAGRAAMTQRLQTWDGMEGESRMPVVIDEFEESACAYPVLRAGRIAGVLIASSAQPGFFANPLACQAIVEYALLLGLGLRQCDLHLYSEVNLKPMPDLRWQRAMISASYMSRILVYARQHKLSLPEAEEFVRREMEIEFEAFESASLAQPEVSFSASRAPSFEQGRSRDV